MSVQSGGQRLLLSMLNEQLTCRLCGGYFIDATTIIECLHSFCRSCIVKYLENSKYCPICEVQVHKSKPLLNIRPDHTLQDIVYKLVPGCYQNEMRCRREFYAKHPEGKSPTMSPESKGEPVESHIYSPDESLSLSLEYYNPSTKSGSDDSKIESTTKSLPRRYLRCPAAVTVFHLQKLIRAKYGLTDAHRVDILYKEEPLCSTYTLMDIMYIYHWRRKVPLHLSYRIFESSPKRIKISEDNAEFKKSLSDAGIGQLEVQDDQSNKREWKEVQLKISETGVMSVTDITNPDSKKNVKTNELGERVKPEESTTTAYDTKESCISVTSNDTTTSKTIDNTKNISENCITRNSTKLQNAAVSKSDDTKSSPVKNEENEKSNNSNSKIVSLKEKPVETDLKESKSTDESRLLMNNNSISSESKETDNQKQNVKLPASSSAGSKINALSAKLQFQPKVGQVNSTYSKKVMKEKKVVTYSLKSSDAKLTKNPVKSESKTLDVSIAKQISPRTTISDSTTKINTSTTVSVTTASSASTTIAPTSTSDNTVSSTKMTSLNATVATSVNFQSVSSTSVSSSIMQTMSSNKTGTTEEARKNLPKQEINSSSLSQTSTVDSLSSSQSKIQTSESKNGKIADNVISDCAKNLTVTSENQSSNATFSYTVKDLMDKRSPSPGQKVAYSKCPIITSCSVSGSQTSLSMMPQFSMQTPLMSIYPTSTSLKNNIHPTTSSSSIVSKSSTDIVSGTCSIPPCPDAIPLSMMKSSMRKNQIQTKSTSENVKISTPGSKIDDICAKIGENSKEKNKLDTRTRPEIPGLLEISKKIEPTIKQFPNIHVPIFKPSNIECKLSYSDKDNAKRILSPVSTQSVQPSASHASQKVSSSKKRPSPSVYKTLRNPPRSWNPTLSKNNYVAVKNQAKELQNQSQQSAYTCDSVASKQIPSKPSKIFTMRNVPRYLGNPASGVKPMYGLVNEAKDKDQSTSSSKNMTINMTKIDPQTLSPIVSSAQYTSNDRTYQSSSFPRDICRSTSSPVSPRNSPVNMLSTNPFIPSHTPNTHPRLIYSTFPPSFSNASRFPHSMMPHSPMGLPPPLSAFHSSLPQVKLFQRSSYAPQTSIYAPVNQPPTVQRMPPSGHSSPKSPKTSSSSAVVDLPNTEAQNTVSTSSKVALSRKDVGAFNLSKSETEINQQAKLDLLAKISTASVDAAIRNSSKVISKMSGEQIKTQAVENMPKSTTVESNVSEKRLQDIQKMDNKIEIANEKNTTDSTKEKEKKESTRINGDVTGDATTENKGKNEEEKKSDGTEKTQDSEGKTYSKKDAANGVENVEEKIEERLQNDGNDNAMSQWRKTVEQVQGKKSEAQRRKAES